MSGLLCGLLLLLAASTVIALAAVAMPVRLCCSLRGAPRWRARIVARPFAGLSPPIPVFDSARRSRGTEKRTAPVKATAAKLRQRVARNARAAEAVPGLIAGVLRAIHLERLEIDADIGCADPADTGELYGLVATLDHAVRPHLPVSIALRPDFSGPCFSGEFKAQLKFVPAAFIPPGIRFARHVFGRNRND